MQYAGMGLSLSYVSFFLPSVLNAKENLLGFKAIPISTEDKIIVPDGYEAKPLISWGDPLFSKAKPFDESKTINAQAIANATLTFGDNNDGMSLFPLSKDRFLLAVNNEYMNPEIMFSHQGKKMTLEDIQYEQNSIGVSIVEIAREKNGFFKVVLDSRYNRRITAHTPMLLGGVVRGDEQVKTSDDPKGERVLGTINNCANGQTPWGTYLTCEENFDDFFGSSDNHYAFNKKQERYGLSLEGAGYGWHLDSRFDLSKNPNEPNRFGYVVEIDPYDPDSTPIKRTSLGRFKHENAEVVINKDGYVVVYMGDDEANEFLYRFVSKNKYNPNNKNANKNILDEGTLYVARFHGDSSKTEGYGEWIELSYGKNGINEENGFFSQADVMIHTRLAASLVKATPLDRPEWVAADPHQEFVYITLTNNTKRTKENIDGVNPREKNQYGQIVRWSPLNKDHTQKEFMWNIFLLAGNPLKYPKDERRGSANITLENMFNSPDGLRFDDSGRLWIQSDGKYSNKDDYEGMGNNQMLCADPATGEVRRFLSGPIGCEITGIIFSEDSKTLLIGVQHPGENLTNSHFPHGKNHTPRSTIVQIRKLDGGIIGT